ncbi:MAG: hemerythrin domain-containing protein [Acidimicrobiales bacterium]
MIHEAFRRDVGRLRDAVRSPDVGFPRARQLRDHWGFVNEQLHHHHRVEDEALWPLLRPKLVGDDQELAVLDEMEAQHLTLEPKCLAVTQGFATYAEQPGGSAGEDLAERLDVLATALKAHLDDEESRGFPVIDRTMSPEEFESFGKATAKAVGMRGSARFFPWIFERADPVERRAVLDMPPAPVRILSRYLWEPRYARQIAALWTG